MGVVYILAGNLNLLGRNMAMLVSKMGSFGRQMMQVKRAVLIAKTITGVQIGFTVGGDLPLIITRLPETVIWPSASMVGVVGAVAPPVAVPVLGLMLPLLVWLLLPALLVVPELAVAPPLPAAATV